MMRLTIKFGVAIGIAALAACAQSDQDNSTATDANAGIAADETILPPDDSSAGSDTLGNQMNQLNESEGAGADVDTANTTGNGY
jgi:hypothetical protein